MFVYQANFTIFFFHFKNLFKVEDKNARRRRDACLVAT